MKGDVFPNQETYDDFQKFMNGDLKLRTGRGNLAIKDIKQDDSIPDSWGNICSAFRESRIINGYPKIISGGQNERDIFQSQEAYEFLKKYLGNQLLNIKYFRDQIYLWEELKNDIVILNDQIEIIEIEEEQRNDLQQQKMYM